MSQGATMTRTNQSQRGFSLLVGLPLLLVVAVLSINGMAMSVTGEKMSGGHMDRSRTMAAAEQALRQGLAQLQANAAICVDGCAVAARGVTPSTARAAAMPSAWNDAGAIDIVKPADQATSARYNVNLLDATFVPTGRRNCMPYSIMGRGVGLDARTSVVLQLTALVCPI